MNRCIGLCLLLAGALSCRAQEFDLHDPSVIALELSDASVVAIGTFGVDRCWPWFDGWHCSGAVHVEESLYGDLKPNTALPFRWKEPYGRSCLVCQYVSRRHGARGIWFLSKKDGVWRFSNAFVSGCGGPSPLDSRDATIRCIRQAHPK
jgi:hypothetical protein